MVTVGEAIVAEDAAVVPEFSDEGVWVVHGVNDEASLAAPHRERLTSLMMAEDGWQDPEGTTDNPPLGRIGVGSRFLDSRPGTARAEIVERIRHLDVEVLAVLSGGVLVFAPVVGEPDRVSVKGFGNRTKGMELIHNHPRSTIFSDADFGVAAALDAGSLSAILSEGGELRVKRPPAGWPDAARLVAAARAGKDDAIIGSVGRTFAEQRHVQVVEINKQLVREFGSDAPVVEEIDVQSV